VKVITSYGEHPFFQAVAAGGCPTSAVFRGNARGCRGGRAAGMRGRGLWRLVVALPLPCFAGMVADSGEVGQREFAAEGCGGWWLPYLCRVSRESWQMSGR